MKYAHMERAIQDGATLTIVHRGSFYHAALVDSLGQRHATKHWILETALDSLDQLCAMDDPRVSLCDNGDRYIVRNHQGIDVGEINAVETEDGDRLCWEVDFYYVGFKGINGADRLVAPLKPDQPIGIGIRYLLQWAEYKTVEECTL